LTCRVEPIDLPRPRAASNLNGRYSEAGPIHPRFRFVEMSRRRLVRIDVIGLAGRAKDISGGCQDRLRGGTVDRVDCLGHVDAF